MAEVIIGVDLGGTRVRAARLDQQLNILAREETLTQDEEGLAATLERIKTLIRRMMPQDGAQVAGIGVSAPGPTNPVTGVVVAPPNLKGWHNVPLGDILHETFGVPVYVGNDANVAGLAEAIRGAGQGYRHLIFTTVSTGIGSGIIVDGRMLLGKVGLAAEAGHMIILAGDRVSTLEKEAAGPALARKARARIEKGEKSLIRDLVGGDLDELSGMIVGQAVQQGDPLALDIVREAGTIIGLGMVTLLHLFNPEILLFGGGVSQIGEPLFAPMREAIRQHAIDSSYWEDLRIEPVALGENVSIVGAAALVPTRGGVEDVTEVAAKLSRV
ncbi:MAG: ROK family protein [Chloroflexi bacterium]|nr:ROK family protein [Chloroflexota bacterium]MDL1885192.1 ROK family protein [Anaerolineae bacterium CFX8]GIL12917.1 MAG: glucokinase [Chloroflexota bacterium]